MLQHTGVRYLGKERCWSYPIAKTKFKFDPK